MDTVLIHTGSSTVALNSIAADFKRGELLVGTEGVVKTYAKSSTFIRGLSKYLESKGLNVLGDEEGEELRWSPEPIKDGKLVFDVGQPFLQSWYARVRRYDMLASMQLNAKVRLLAEQSNVERWAGFNSKERRPLFKKLIQILTTDSPESAVVVPQEDPQIEAIVKRGKFFPAKGRRRVNGLSNQCHANTAALFAGKKIDAIVTGYGLAEDGGWRSHTWGLLNGKLIETTRGSYVRYFGVQLNVKEAKAFVSENPLP